MIATYDGVEQARAKGLVAHEPQLYVLARPTLDKTETGNFLEEENVAWRRSSEAVDAEEIVELGGRICYMSFGSMQSPR